MEAFRANAAVISGRVEAEGIGSAGAWMGALVDVKTLHFTVSLESCLALAQEVSGKVAALCVFDASRRHCWIIAFVYV